MLQVLTVPLDIHCIVITSQCIINSDLETAVGFGRKSFYPIDLEK